MNAMKPHVLSVGISKDTPFAFDYGWKRLLACGCFSTVVILDPTNARCVQSLQGHRSTVSLLSWAPENYYHDLRNPYFLRLATVDISGTIIIWDAIKALAIAEFIEAGSTVLDLSWISNQSVSRDLLLVLHSKGLCVLWNAQTRTQLWKIQVDDTLNSFVLDPLNSDNILFSGPNFVKIVNNFSVMAPFTFKRVTLLSDTRNEIMDSTIRLSLLLRKLTIPVTKESSVESESPVSPPSVPPSDCIQVCYHGHRTRCAILLFKRQLAIVDLSLLSSVVTIPLDRGQASFLRVYSCVQRDVLICLHENGSLSVYARKGLASPMDSASRTMPPSESPEGEAAPYDLVAQTQGSRRSNRQSLRLRFSVDRSREVNIAVLASEGRIHFWQLRQVPLQPLSGSFVSAPEPCWTLKDIVPHSPGSSRVPKLYLQLTSMYTASKANVTTCRVCPHHFLKPLATQLGCHALVAVGNSRGGVQIWDMVSGLLWREFQLLPVPILGVEWLTIPQNLEYPAEADKSYDDYLSTSIQQQQQQQATHHLGLVVHGWQSKDRSGSSSSYEESKLEGSNHICLLNLATGLVENFRLGPSGIVGGFKASNRASRNTQNKGESVLEGPIELARMSHLGQYLALLIRNECIELWNMISLKLIDRITFDPSSYGVTLDWYQSVIRVSDAGSTRPLTMLPISPASTTLSRVSTTQSTPSDQTQSVTYQRESFVLCSHPLNLRLIIVEGDKIDTTVVSSTILQGLPPTTTERISAVAWFADLIAFGTADGFLAVRDLHAKKTAIRMTSSLGWLNITDPPTGVPVDSTLAEVRSVLNTMVSVSRYTTGVRRLAFLPGSSTASRLLVLLYDSIYLWEPREMNLICTARFDGRLQRCLISADWACPITSPDPAMCLVVGAEGALRLVEAGGGDTEMIPLAVSPGQASSADQPTSRFISSSPMLTHLNDIGPQLHPFVFPTVTAMVIRYLLQHQPWRTTRPSAAEELLFLGSENVDLPKPKASYSFSCPTLAPWLPKVESFVRCFLNTLEERPEYRKSFLNPSASIVERCLWTAQLFDDTYEVRFWSVVANRLLPHSSERYTLDLSYGLLADHKLFREAALVHVKLMGQANYSLNDVHRSIHQSILLGQHERALSLLLESSPDSPQYTVNMLRACLLASHCDSVSSVTAKAPVLAEDTHLSTIKLVATNFLSCGQLDRGIELLCLIGMSVDACRYLESFDGWDRALWLAKCTLPPEEINNVFRRWAAHLSSQQVSRKDSAVLIYVLLGEHDQALKLLYELGQYQLAARYLEACFEANVLDWNSAQSDLYRQIFCEFTKILLKLGHYESARYYCDQAGIHGEPLRKEVETMIS